MEKITNEIQDKGWITPYNVSLFMIDSLGIIHLVSTQKFSEKLKFLTLWYLLRTQTCAYQGLKVH